MNEVKAMKCTSKLFSTALGME